jgi:hypothetical protein
MVHFKLRLNSLAISLHKKKGKGKKRKSTDIIEVLEKQNTEFTTKMEEFHRDKMARFDQLLDLYSQEVKRGDKS